MLSSTSPNLIAVYSDIQDWIPLGEPASEIAPQEAQQPTEEGTRFTVWLGDTPVARGSFHQLDTVVELRDFFVADGYIANYGIATLQSIVKLASVRGDVLTIESYPPGYSRSFLGAGFKQNTRTRMVKSLANHSTQSIELPEGIRVRNPIFDDEYAVSGVVHNNYIGTADAEMVSSSRAQAAAIIHAMFHNDYNLLLPTGSYLAFDPSGNLIADVLLGDASRDATERQAWIMDISIAPHYRGKGLGKALLLMAINAAHAHSYPSIGLMVTIGSVRAQALYRSLGFEDFGDIMYEAILMLK